MTRNVSPLTGNIAKKLCINTFAAICILMVGLPKPAFSEGDESHVCDQVASVASAQTGVPLSVLKAISLTETGRKRGGQFRPWPWTVNMEGKGVWFDAEDEARAYVYKHFKRGARSFDVGCFQINYKWHHQNFSSLEEMFDPLANGIYAAKFLSDLYEEKGNWRDAAGAYHSRTPKYADRYKERFAKFRAKFIGQDSDPIRVASVSQEDVVTPPPIIDLLVPRVNNFPLLQSGTGAKALGSLVPSRGSAATPFILQNNG